MNNKYAVCIPTYKNRFRTDTDKKTSKTFNRLTIAKIDEIPEYYDVFLYLSPNDFKESGYDKYNFKREVNFIETDANNVGEKFEYIRKDMVSRGYDGYILIEDDIVLGHLTKITPESKRTTSNTYHQIYISVQEYLDKLVSVFEETGYALVETIMTANLGFSKPGKQHIDTSVMGACLMLRTDAVKNLHYRTDVETIWDVDFAISLLAAGYHTIKLGDYGFEWYTPNRELFKKNYSSLVIEDSKVAFKRYVELYNHWGDLIVIKQGDKGDYRCVVKWRKIPKDGSRYELPENTELREACKNYDFEKIQQFIKREKKQWTEINNRRFLKL